MTTQENWKPIPGWEGLYEVSDLGRVRSLDRICSNGVHKSGRVLKQSINRDGYRGVVLRSNRIVKNVRVNRAVAEAFIGAQPPSKPFVLHNDDDKSNNCAWNLRWGDQTDNMRDRTRNGSNPYAIRTTCPKGHTYDEVNTYVSKAGKRHCRACHNESEKFRKRRMRATASKEDSK